MHFHVGGGNWITLTLLVMGVTVLYMWFLQLQVNGLIFSQLKPGSWSS